MNKDDLDRVETLLAKHTNEISENSTGLKLLAKGVEYMTKGLDELKNTITEFRQEIRLGFVTKQEFDSMKKDVEEIKTQRDWVIKIIVGAVILALLALIGLSKT